VSRIWLIAAWVGLAGLVRAEPPPGGAESLIRWEWRVRWLQDVPELNLLVWNQTDHAVFFEFHTEKKETGCGRVAVGGRIAARSWSHRAVTLLEARGKLPCELALSVLSDVGAPLKPPTVQTGHSTLVIGPRVQELPPARVAAADVTLRAVVEAGCAPGAASVRVLVESHSARPTRVRSGAWGARCADGTKIVWERIERDDLELPAGGWAVFVDSVRAPKSSQLGACTAWLDVLGGDDAAPVALGHVEFSLAPQSSEVCADGLE